METREGVSAEKIQKVISEKIITGSRPEDVDDHLVASLDSIGRLTLLVELENIYGIELMGPDLDPDVFSSLKSLTEYVARKAGSPQTPH